MITAQQPAHGRASIAKLVALFKQICGDAYVITDPAVLYMYGKDQTGDQYFPFDILLKPACAKEIADVLLVCNRYKIPVTPRGGGSGVTGGALPCKGGIVLSTERLNRIIEINKTNAFVIAEAGVVTDDLKQAVEDWRQRGGKCGQSKLSQVWHYSKVCVEP